MPTDLLTITLPTAQFALALLGGFYLLAGLWLVLAPRLFRTPGLVVISVDQLPLERSFSLESNRSQWQRLFQTIGYACLALCLLCWSVALSFG